MVNLCAADKFGFHVRCAVAGFAVCWKSRPLIARGRDPKLETNHFQILRVWSPIALGAVLVSIAGSDLFSWANTESLTRPVFERLYPHKSAWDITLLTFEVRKLGHVVVYGIVAVMIVRVAVSLRLAKATASAMTVGIVAVLATADEVHQATSPARTGRILDVAFDIGIAMIALLVYWGIKYWSIRRAPEIQNTPG